MARRGGRPETATPPRRTIAVLPLQHLSGDRAHEYFADGMTDAIIGELTRIPELRVISRTSVMTYKGTRQRLPAIARRLGAGAVVEGSVLRSADHVRIRVRLVNAARDLPVWNASYEGEFREVLRLEQQVADAIAREIGVRLTGAGRRRATSDRPVNLDAYDTYLRGRHEYFAGFTRESIEKSIAYFRQALALDPGYAPAYTGLAGCYFGLSTIYLPPKEVMPKAKWAAEKAIELDDTLGEAHASLALVKSLYEYDRIAAEKEFRRALELRASDASAHLWYSQHLAGLGRFDAALAEVERAQELDPVSPAMIDYVGLPLFLAHRYDQAIRRLLPIAEVHPDYHQPHAFLALAYEQKKDWVPAIAEMQLAYRLDSEPEALAQLGHVYAVAGRTTDARNILSQLMEVARRRYVSAYDIAVLHAGLGDQTKRFAGSGRWMRTAPSGSPP